MKLAKLLMESETVGKTFVSVDIQPEYENGFDFQLYTLVEFLNTHYDDMAQLVFLYNGHETLGMIREMDYKMWWLENGLREDIVDSAIFYDKGYAFFRYCMDSGLDHDVTVNFIRFLYENDIRDSREMDRNMWAKYLRQYRRTDKKEAHELLASSADCVNIPDLMDFIKRFSNLVLTGGGINECLKEVEIALQALNKSYKIFSKFTY